MLTNPRGWTDYLDALGIIAEVRDPRRRGDRRAHRRRHVVQRHVPFGNFQASLHWTDGGNTPWNMYSNIMDGACYVPLGETATWNFGRYENAEVTEALAGFKTEPGTRPQAALDVVQQHFVEDVPGLIIWSARGGPVLHGELHRLPDGRRSLREPAAHGSAGGTDPVEAAPTE